MSNFGAILQNTPLWAAIIGWAAAQGIKIILTLITEKKFDASRIMGTGGMPSSHSATVCALVTATGMQYGAASYEFAMAAIFALVVMYDAIGVRQESGKQAKVINDMVELFAHMGKDVDIEKQLKEFIGHTPLQVFCGGILGIVTALIIMGL